MTHQTGGLRGGRGRATRITAGAVRMLTKVARFEIANQRMPLLGEVVDISVPSIDAMRVLRAHGLAFVDGAHVTCTRPGISFLRRHGVSL